MDGGQRDPHAVAAAAPTAPTAPTPATATGPASLAPFALERFFALHEFTARHLLCCSDCEPWTVRDLLGGDGKAEALLGGVRLAYTETRGDPALRAAVARRVYASTAPPLDPSGEILVLTPQEGIFLATLALALRPGELVVATKPGYQSLYAVAESSGARVLPWRPRAAAAADAASGGGRDGRLAFDARDLEALLRPLINAPAGAPPEPVPPLLRAVFVNLVCHNPTGFLATDALWENALSLLAEADAAQRWRCEARGLAPPAPIVLFSDEMYAHMEPWRDGLGGGGDADAEGCEPLPPPPPPPPPRILTALDLKAPPGVSPVVLCGLSKSWGCPGLRLGWLASRDAALLDRASQLRDYTTICSPAPCEHLALAAVEATGRLTRAARGRVAANVRLASAFFGARWSGLFEWPGTPDAGPICFPAAKGALLEAAGAADVGALCDRLAAEAGVLLLPATVYADEGDGDDEGARAALGARFRLGLGREGFAEGLAVLDAWLVQVCKPPA